MTDDEKKRLNDLLGDLNEDDEGDQGIDLHEESNSLVGWFFLPSIWL